MVPDAFIQDSYDLIVGSIYSFAVYVGSSIYSPTVEQVMEEFNVGAVTASLGLALYVLAYGIGPMLFSPLSESVLARFFYCELN